MQCFRFKNLVYVPIFKNASTTYSTLFQKNGWAPWLIDYLDWKGDIIFGHISDPYQRHIKGVVEYLNSRGLIDYLDDAKFLALVSHGFFDQHSYPLHMMLGNHVNDIYWIPIDHPKISSEELTCKFLAKHDVFIDTQTIQNINHTINSKTLEARKKILQQCEKHNFRNDNQYFALNFDNMIYQSCISKFDNWCN